MAEIALTDTGELAEAAAQAREQQEPIWLSQGGQPVAAVVDAVTLQRLLRRDSQRPAEDNGPFGDADKADLGL